MYLSLMVQDINTVDVSPNDRLLVSGSQDKTVKMWGAKDGALLGTFRGHRRGVWSVKFSPVDQVYCTHTHTCACTRTHTLTHTHTHTQCVASASGDGTVKLWAISDFSCVKTFEGHSSSVLKVVFLSRGMQLASR